MPATIENDTLLKAFNQTIQALLDLATSISNNSNGCPDVTVNVPASEPVINVYNTIKCGGCGSGGSGSVGSGSPVDSDPTDGYIPGNDPVVDAAKCKRVNYVIDKYLDFLGLWGAVEGLLAIGPAEALATYLLGSSSLVFSSILVAGALVTLFWSVVTLFVGGLVVFSYIVAHAVDVRANREELTCAMYNAATPGDMRQAIIDFMSNHLAGLPQSFVTYHVDAIFSNNVLNGVFNGWTDAGVNAELSAYTPPVGCDICNPGEVVQIVQTNGAGQQMIVIRSTDETHTTCHSVDIGGLYLISFRTNDPAYSPVKVTLNNLVGHSNWVGGNDFRAGNQAQYDIIETESFYSLQTALLSTCIEYWDGLSGQIVIISSTPFTVDASVSECD